MDKTVYAPSMPLFKGTETDEKTGPSLAKQQKVMLEKMYQDYRQEVLQYLLSLVKNHSIAEELLQDTFVRLSKVPAIGMIRQPRPFLMKTASNLAMDYFRQQKKQPIPETEDVCAELIDPIPEQLELVVSARQNQQLKHAIQQLPPRAKEALMLAKFKEMTLKEVAKEMDISQTMVEKHLKNALQHCRSALTSDRH
jgi:RNA polymerase sigma factor (sigma-70 family)